jgi:hypothetical protein
LDLIGQFSETSGILTNKAKTSKGFRPYQVARRRSLSHEQRIWGSLGIEDNLWYMLINGDDYYCNSDMMMIWGYTIWLCQNSY